VDVKLQRAGLIVLVALVTLGVLTGVQFGWKKFMLDGPVKVKLSTVQGVSGVSLDQEKTKGIIEVMLTDVPNLKETAQSVLEAAGGSKVKLLDKRTPELLAVMEKTRFDIEEAMMRGNFTAMEKAIDGAAKSAKLDRYGVYMDSDNIYLQLHKGENYLYQIFPRKTGKVEITTD